VPFLFVVQWYIVVRQTKKEYQFELRATGAIPAGLRQKKGASRALWDGKMVLGLDWQALPSSAGMMGYCRVAQQEWPVMVHATFTSCEGGGFANRCVRHKPYAVGPSGRPK